MSKSSLCVSLVKLRSVCSLTARFFATFFAFWVLRRLHDEQWMDYLQPFPWGNEPFLAFVCGVPVGVAVWFLTADGMPTWLRNFYVLPSFVAAVLCAPHHPLRL